MDFLFQSAPKSEEGNDAVIIKDKKNLAQLLTLMTLEGDFPINVRIGTQIFDYHSYLKLGMANDQVGTTNLFLIIDALDPAIGNLRIKKSSTVLIRMSTKRYNLEFQVQFIEVVGRNVLKLTFPEYSIIRTEKRAAVRISIDQKWGLTTSVTRKAGLTFPVKLVNISSGGLYFQPQGEIPQIGSGSEIICHFKWKPQKIKCDTKAIVIERVSIEETVHYRARFIFEQYDSAMRDLESMVATAQLRQIQRRRELFTDFETPVGDNTFGKGKPSKKKKK